MNQHSKWIAVALVLLGIVLASIIANRVPGQWDVTAASRYTLSEASHNLLDELSEPVRMEFYFSRSVEDLPIQFKNFASRVQNLLRQYQRASSGQLRLRIIDPRPDTDEEQEAIRAGLRGQPVPSGANVFFGLRVLQADSSASIPFFRSEREPFLEYDISQLIYQVGQLDKPRLGILSSLDLQDPPPQNPMMPQQNQGDSGYAFMDEIRNLYEVEIIEGDDFPDDLHALLVLHPQNLSEARQFRIDQFVLSGKPVLIAVDPSSYTQRANQNQQQMMMGQQPDVSSNLPRLFDTWGLAFDPARVVGDRNLAAEVSTRTGGAPLRYPVWLNFQDIDSDSPLLASLNSLLLVEPGALRLRDNAPDSVQWDPLLQTTSDAGTVPASLLAFPNPERVGRSLQSDKQAITLAGILRGSFPTAFPDGPPEKPTEDNPADSDNGNTNTESTPLINPDDQLTESNGTSTVMVIADTDFLSDQFAVRAINMFGMRGLQPLNDNLALLNNAVDSLAGNPELMSLRGKGTGNRPFTVVEKIEREAQQDYEDQLQNLEQRLSEVQTRLQELQQTTADENQLVASPQTRQAIEEFRLEEAEVRAQQREIRKKLREDIEALNLRLALLNLFTFPLLVGIGGLAFFLKRNRS